MQHFSQSFLGVKSAYQLLHLIKHIFQGYIGTSSLQEVNFAIYDEQQNRALYTIKTLMMKVTKEFGGVLKQKLISLEMITEKKIQEPIDYYST
jgi:hypothetical protein